MFNLLKGKFGEKEAEQFVSLIKEKVEETVENKKEILATKEDISALALRIEAKLTQLQVMIAKTESK